MKLKGTLWSSAWTVSIRNYMRDFQWFILQLPPTASSHAGWKWGWWKLYWLGSDPEKTSTPARSGHIQGDVSYKWSMTNIDHAQNKTVFWKSPRTHYIYVLSCDKGSGEAGWRPIIPRRGYEDGVTTTMSTYFGSLHDVAIFTIMHITL